MTATNVQPSLREHRGVVPVVVRADVDPLEPDRLVIRGKHFGVKSAPTVLLASIPLDVLSFSDEQIVARLPIDAPPASYRLQVVANGTVPSRFFEVTVGGRPGRSAGAQTSSTVPSLTPARGRRIMPHRRDKTGDP